jgi:hypothetical protein
MPAVWQIARPLWGFGLGTAFFIMFYMVIANAWWRAPAGEAVPEMDPAPQPQGQVDDFPEGLQEAHGKVTPWVKWYMIAFAIWAVGYVTVFILWSNGLIYLPPITAAPYSEATKSTLPHFIWPGL